MPSEIIDADLPCQIEALQQRVAELEAALVASEKNFHTLTDSAPVGIYLDDAQGRAIFVNKKCAELVGVPASDALNFDWISSLHPDDRERMVAEWTRAFENSQAFRLEYRWLHPDGKIVWTLGEVTPILGSDGKATLYIGTLTDITARKEAEIAREEMEAQLIQAQKMESIGRLAGGVAHDYNNILCAIIGYTEMTMAEVDPSGSVHFNLQKILEAATRSAEVTRQLLAFARKQIVSHQVFDINDSLAALTNMLGRLIGEDIHLSWSRQPYPSLINMDPSQFDQIVINLCVNARDAISGAGYINIETGQLSADDITSFEHLSSGASGEFVVLTVSDNGSGMDKATLENIFEPFFTTKSKEMGTGLGLASVYGTVKQNNGFIDVQSSPGKGTTFKIYLPRHFGPALANKATDPACAINGFGETVLVVEDEVAILNVIKVILDGYGYTVLTADSPAKAFDLASDFKEEIHLLVTDMIMPETNGPDLAKRLMLNRPDMKCLFMSGYPANTIAKHNMLKTSVHFIQKPFRKKDLIAKVQGILHPDNT